MDLMLPMQPEKLAETIQYRDKVIMTGSCFSEHIGSYLDEIKFSVLQNPNGILYDPVSITGSIVSYIQNKQYKDNDLFFLDELWHSWNHHGHFSGTAKEEVLADINTSQQQAHRFLKEAKWLIITPGTAFSYRLTAPGAQTTGNEPGTGVANCHKAPASWFTKHLLSIEEINSVLDNCLHQLFQFNPGLRIIFTVSPVRHIRDGVIENNRSKARLLEVIHHLVNKFDKLYYFPSYELVIDVLRDYRFYETDMVHPNKQAIQYVQNKFMQSCVDEPSQQLAKEVQKIVTARKHLVFQPATEAYRKFLQTHLEKVRKLQQEYPFLDLQRELEYFSG